MLVKFVSILYLLCGLNSPAYEDGRLERCEPYRREVVASLDAEGVARFYYFLMVAESGCRDGAESGKGAIGFWQLMPNTAKRFGCPTPHHLHCATRASARYIQTLEKRFSSEEWVVYAYNMGGTNLKRAKRPTGQALGLWATICRLKREFSKTAIRVGISQINAELTERRVR